MSLYKITLHGCDDSTQMTMELTESEAAFIRRLVNLSKQESTYGCMPTMSVRVLVPQHKGTNEQ